MNAKIASWSERKRFNVGMWCSPLFMWTLCGVQTLILRSLDRRALHYVSQLPSWGHWLVFMAMCMFWLSCAAFAGLCAAFFWCKLDLDIERRREVTFHSVVITWVPTILYCCGWVILWLPFLIHLSVFRLAVEQGINFWNSNHPREWVGDFSNPDAPDEN